MAIDRSFFRNATLFPAVKIALEKFLNLFDSRSQQPAPATATGTATLTTAQMLSKILVSTPGGAATYTTPTGTALKAALQAVGPLEANDTFDLTVINVGSTTQDVTMAGGTDVTFVGEVILRPGADAATEHAGQGTWRFRYTTGVTFIGYRVA